MRAAIWSAIAVAGLAAGLVATLDAGADRKPCAVKPGYHVVANKRESIVIAKGAPAKRVYGCYRPRGRMVRLSRHSPIYRLAGYYVAYRDYCGACRTYDVYVVDLRTHGHVFVGRAAYSDVGTQDDGSTPGTITDLTLKRNGSFAWISCRTGRGPESPCRGTQPRFAVWRSDLESDSLLDRSTRIRPHSLRRHHSRMSWRHGSRRRHARLR